MATSQHIILLFSFPAPFLVPHHLCLSPAPTEYCKDQIRRSFTNHLAHFQIWQALHACLILLLLIVWYFFFYLFPKQVSILPWGIYLSLLLKKYSCFPSLRQEGMLVAGRSVLSSFVPHHVCSENWASVIALHFLWSFLWKSRLIFKLILLTFSVPRK